MLLPTQIVALYDESQQTLDKLRAERLIAAITAEVDAGFWTGGLGGADAVPF